MANSLYKIYLMINEQVADYMNYMNYMNEVYYILNKWLHLLIRNGITFEMIIIVWVCDPKQTFGASSQVNIWTFGAQ